MTFKIKKFSMRFLNLCCKDNIFFACCILAVVISSFLLWRWLSKYLGITGYLTTDDLASIQFALIGDNILDKLKGIICYDPTNVPLFYLLLCSWLHMFGFTVSTMHILPEIFAASFIIVVAFIGKKVQNRKMGIVASVLAGTSIQLIYASYQIRAYSLLMLCSAIVFLVWLYQKENWQYLFLFSIFLFLISFTHFFGVLVCASLGSWDFLCVISKKKNGKVLVPYVMYASLFIPYVLISYFNTTNLYGTFWPSVPGYLDFLKMAEYICSGRRINFVIFIFIGFFYVFVIIDKILKKEKLEKINKNIVVCYWTVSIVLIVGFIYSRYINPDSSVWVARYFLVVYPFTITILSYGIYHLGIWIKESFCFARNVSIALIMTLFFLYNYQNVEYAVSYPHEICTGYDFEALSEYLTSQKDINDDSTLIYFPYPKQYFDGWLEFYTQNGKIECPNVCCRLDLLYEMDLNKYKTIYTIEVSFDLQEAGKPYIEQTHQLIGIDCEHPEKVGKYVRIGE